MEARTRMGDRESGSRMRERERERQSWRVCRECVSMAEERSGDAQVDGEGVSSARGVVVGFVPQKSMCLNSLLSPSICAECNSLFPPTCSCLSGAFAATQILSRDCSPSNVRFATPNALQNVRAGQCSNSTFSPREEMREQESKDTFLKRVDACVRKLGSSSPPQGNCICAAKIAGRFAFKSGWECGSGWPAGTGVCNSSCCTIDCCCCNKEVGRTHSAMEPSSKE